MNNTVNKAISILQLLAKNSSGLTLAEISRILNIPKSSAFDLVHTLENRGFIEAIDNRLKNYKLGVEAFCVGQAYLHGTSIEVIANPILSELREETDETVFMSMPVAKADLVYTMKFSPRASAIKMAYSVGDTRPLLSLGMGKAILAAHSDQEVAEIMEGYDYGTSSISSITDLTSLTYFLNLSRMQGFVRDSTSENGGYASPVAAPILGLNRKVIGAISIVIMKNAESDAKVYEMGKMVQQTALNISRKLGFVEDDLYIRSRS